MNPDVWDHYLREHPDRILVKNFVRGLKEGFPIGFTGPRTTFESPPREHTNEELVMIRREFDREVQLGRMAGPFSSLPTTGPYKNFHRTNPTFIIPKRDPSKFRRIEHLSFPPGESVNDFIRKEDFPVDYTSVEKMTEVILKRDEGTFVSNVDIKDAYRHIPLNPADCPLFCFEVNGDFYLQLRMGFGGRSFCSIFDTASELTAWILLHHTEIPGYEGSGIKDVEAILDDFTCFHSDLASENTTLRLLEYHRVLSIFDDLGFPLATHKLQPPATTFNAIGLSWNTIERTISIPKDKLDRYDSLLSEVFPHEEEFLHYDNTITLFVTIPKLRSILGILVYISRLSFVGRTRLFYLFRCLRAAESKARQKFGIAALKMKRFPGKTNLVHLNRDAVHDLRWWQACIPRMPSRLLLRRRLYPDNLSLCPILTTDASGWGIGGFYTSTDGDTSFFSIPYSRYGLGVHSTYGELLACAVSACLWDLDWKYNHIVWRTDCEPHVHGLFKIRTQAPALLPLHDFLDLRAATGCYQYAPKHIPGLQNTIADQLSRGIVEVPTSWRRCHPVTGSIPEGFGVKLRLCANNRLPQRV